MEFHFFRPVPAQPLGLFRIGVGSILFAYYLQTFFAAYEIFSPIQMGYSAPFLSHWSTLTLFNLISVGAAAAAALGWHTKMALALLMICQAIHVVLNPFAFWGWGFVIIYFLGLLMLTRCTCYSLDERFQNAARFVPAWNILIFQILVSAIYLLTVLHRWHSEEWWDGTVLSMALADGWVTRFPGVDWIQYSEPLKLFSHAAWLMECVAALAIFLGPLKTILAPAMIGFHTMLEITTRVGYWQFLLSFAMVFYFPARWFQTQMPSPKPRFPWRPWIPAVILAATAIAIFDALPEHMVPKNVHEVRRQLASPLERVGLTTLRAMWMFNKSRKTGRHCFFAGGMNREGQPVPVYTSLEQCTSQTVQLFTDERFATIARMWMSGQFGILGRYLCRPGIRSVHFFNMQEHIVKNSNGTFQRDPQSKHEFSYDCGSGALDRNPPDNARKTFALHFGDQITW
jgi:hypothetical protein